MKDSLLLLAIGLGLALTSWAFWRYAGSNGDALCVFVTVGFVCVVADNVKLRRQLRERKTKV
jgi:hypothetical protein